MSERKQLTENNSLGKLIEQYLKKKKLSAAQLSKELEYDASVIRSFIRGARVPKYPSEILERIAKKLEIPPLDMDKCHRNALKEKEEKLSHPKQPRRDVAYYTEPLTGLSPSDQIKCEDFREHFQDEHFGAIRGCTNLMQTKIAMLRELLQQDKIPENNNIYTIFMGKKSIFSWNKELEKEYQSTLSKVIVKGWNVFHLIRLDPNCRERTYELVSNSFRFFEGKGKYEPRYLSAKTVLNPPYGIFLISNKEALITFSADEKDAADSAIYIKDGESIDIIHSHCQQVLAVSEPIFTEIEYYDQKSFVETLTNADQEAGDRFIIASRLSEITRPLTWYDKDHPWAKALIQYLESTGSSDLTRHIPNRQRRAKNLRDYLEIGKYTCHYIYPKTVFEEFVQKGCASPYYYEASYDERIEQIKTTSDLLGKDSYEMAIVDDSQEQVFGKIKPSFCEVQGNHLVFMEVWTNDESGKEISKWYLSQEPIVVRAFQERLRQIWNSLNDKDKDKFTNLQYLNRKNDQLELKKLEKKREINNNKNN